MERQAAPWVLNPCGGEEAAERGKGGSRSNGAGGKRSGAAVQAPALVSALAGSPNGQTVYKDMSRLLKKP